jgi:DNA-directed RNA polymerase specialized sigma24 family protein
VIELSERDLEMISWEAYQAALKYGNAHISQEDVEGELVAVLLEKRRDVPGFKHKSRGYVKKTLKNAAITFCKNTVKQTKLPEGWIANERNYDASWRERQRRTDPTRAEIRAAVSVMVAGTPETGNGSAVARGQVHEIPGWPEVDRDRLHKLWQSLPEERCQLLMDAVVNHVGYDQIGADLGISYSAAKTRVDRLLDHICEQMGHAPPKRTVTAGMRTSTDDLEHGFERQVISNSQAQWRLRRQHERAPNPATAGMTPTH